MCLFFWVLVAGQELRPALWHCTIVFLVLAAAGMQGCHYRTKVMLEHRDIAFRRAAPFRQGVRKQAAGDLQPGFL